MADISSAGYYVGTQDTPKNGAALADSSPHDLRGCRFGLAAPLVALTFGCRRCIRLRNYLFAANDLATQSSTFSSETVCGLNVGDSLAYYLLPTLFCRIS